MAAPFRSSVTSEYPSLMRSFCSWQARRSRDVYTRRAAAEGLRNRAAYKLIEMTNKYRLLRHDSHVVDLGSAPGGFAAGVAKTVRLDDRVRRWEQQGNAFVKRRITGRRRSRPFGKLVCVDVVDMAEIGGASFIRGSVMESGLEQRIGYALNGDEADVVLCDAAPSTTGNSEVDHIRCVDMAKAGLDIANAVLRNGGAFVVKVFRGGEESQLVEALRQDFLKSKTVKPKASVKESREIYYVCTGFVPPELREGQGLTNEQIDDAMRAAGITATQSGR